MTGIHMSFPPSHDRSWDSHPTRDCDVVLDSDGCFAPLRAPKSFSTVQRVGVVPNTESRDRNRDRPRGASQSITIP